MRQADFPTLRATAATPSTMAATPVQSNMRATDATGSGGSFGSVFRQVQGEVARFIEQGGGSATTLNPQGRAYLEQSQPVNVLGSINQGGEIGEVQQQFLASIKPWTEETGARLGVAPEIVAAHAERFRSYPDQASAFRDYAQVLLDNPRYRAALNTGSDAGAFAQGLARGGYATDPHYAAKLTQLATRLQRTAAAE